MIAPGSGRAPWNVVALIAAFAAVSGFVVGARSARMEISASSPRDSIRAERTLDTAHLGAWADSVLRLRGDSLAAVWLARPARRLPARIAASVAKDAGRDTVWLPGAAVRADAVMDSAREQVVDSVRGELVQREYDLQECAAALTCAPRPTSWQVSAGIIGDVDGIRPTASVGRHWGRFEVEGGAVVDRTRPGIIASARWSF